MEGLSAEFPGGLVEAEASASIGSSVAVSEAAAWRLAAIVNSSEDAIIGKTLDGIITSWNPGAEKLFGYREAEALGRRLLMLIPPDRIAEEQSILEQIARGESVKHFETVRVRKGGLEIDVSVSISPIIDPSGRIVGASKIAREITERKRVERRLRDDELRMHLATEATQVGIWEWNLRTHQVRWDPQMFRIYGLSPTADGHVSYSVWREAVVAEDLPAQESTLQETIRKLGRSQREFRIRRPGESDCRYIEAVETVCVDAQGRAEWLIGTNLDITERKKNQVALLESEERFRTMANSIPQLAWVARADGYITWYNRRWYEYTGTTPGQMLGWGWQEVHQTAHLPRVLELWRQAIDSGQPFDMEFPLRGADGRFRTFLTRGLPFRDANGRITHWFGTNTDIDALKAGEERILQLNNELETRVRGRTAELETANRELEAFSYSVSHDLRAPLRGIDGYIQMLQEDYGTLLDAEGRRLLGVVSGEARRMGRLIDDLLAFSRMGRQTMGHAAVDMTALVREVLVSLPGQDRVPKVRFDLAELPTACGDRAMLRQVWANLLGNAVKFTGQQAAPRIEVFGEQNGNESVYTVRDNGVGFDERYAHKLFGVFQRLHGESQFEGTGVGLALVQRIVQRHGGRVWARSRLGTGASFSFAIPRPERGTP